MSLTYTTNILCAATDVGMHGLLAVNRVTILLPFCVTPLFMYIVDQ